jgi:hypothetical protein
MIMSALNPLGDAKILTTAVDQAATMPAIAKRGVVVDRTSKDTSIEQDYRNLYPGYDQRIHDP